MIRRRELLAGAGLLFAEPALAHVRGIGGRLRARPAGGGGPPATPVTWDPAKTGVNATLANGNRDYTTASSGFATALSTVGKSTGKWYAEITIVSMVGNSGGVGFGNAGMNTDSYLGATASGGMLYFASTGTAFANGVGAGTWPGTGTLTAGDIYTLALDLGTGKGWTGKNGTWYGDPVAETTEMWNTIPSDTWFIGATQAAGNGIDFLLASTTTYAPPTGYSVWNA